MGKFVIKPAKEGCKFDFVSDSGHTVVTSQVYKSELGCKTGIASVQKNSALNKIEDQCLEDFSVLPNPKFEVYKDNAGKFRFRLRARNGSIIAVSEDFKAKEDALKVVAIVINEAPKAKSVKA